MPTNLPPEYFEADKHFRQAKTLAEKIERLEVLISTVPKHKGTDKLRADLRRQLSRLKDEVQPHKKHYGHQTTFSIEKEGAGQVVLIGPTNVGKSTLVAALTHAEPEVSEVPYTTRTPVPGMMPIGNIQVQLVDTPPLEEELAESGLYELIRQGDMILLILDLQADPLTQLQKSAALLSEHQILPKSQEKVESNQARVTYLPMLILANKCDDENLDEEFQIFCALFEGECPVLPVSAATGRNFDLLKKRIFENLSVVRVYAKPPGKPADLEKPFVLKKGSTVIDLAGKIHRDFYEKLKSARIWGSAQFDGQMVQKDYILQDGDIVELRL